MQAALSPESLIGVSAAKLATQYKAHGELELMFVREIASAKVTFDSLQRAVNSLDPAVEANAVHIELLSRAKIRYQRMKTIAIRELRALQGCRNILERFPDQTRDCAPLADHTPFIGNNPAIKPISALLRGRLASPRDHTPMRSTEPDPERRAKGLPDIRRLVPDPAAARLPSTTRR